MTTPRIATQTGGSSIFGGKKPIKPGTRVIVRSCSPGETPDEGRQPAFDAGAVDCLAKGGIHEQVREAIFRAMARTAELATAGESPPASMG